MPAPRRRERWGESRVFWIASTYEWRDTRGRRTGRKEEKRASRKSAYVRGGWTAKEAGEHALGGGDQARRKSGESELQKLININKQPPPREFTLGVIKTQWGRRCAICVAGVYLCLYTESAGSCRGVSLEKSVPRKGLEKCMSLILGTWEVSLQYNES